MAGYYEERQDLWDSIPGVEHLGDEYDEAYDLFLNILDDVETEHIRPQDSAYWDDFIDLFGFDREGDVWDWDDFRDWYDAA